MDDTTTAAWRVITEAEYCDATDRVRWAARHAGITLTENQAEDLATAALVAAGILTPPPTPEPGTCTALWADEDGVWLQCDQDPGHTGTHTEEGGEWEWADQDPNAVAPQN